MRMFCSFMCLVYYIFVMIMPNPEELKKIKILIADDHPLVSIALRRIFDPYDEFEVIAEAENGEAAVRLATELSPDLIIMDISMPILSGFEASKRIKSLHPEILILIFTVYSDLEHVCGIFDAEADGYLLKTAQSDEILQSVRGLIAGDSVISRQVFKNILGKRVVPLLKSNLEFGINVKVSTQETEILLLISKGFSNKEIADKLNLSIPTVKNYLTEIFTRLNVSSRAEAVTRAFKYGIIDLDSI